jgi:hypothetical protein
MNMKSTPVDIIEGFFDLELKRSSLQAFDQVPTDWWVDFARHYRTQMDNNFAHDFLWWPAQGPHSMRLYFEPRMRDLWSAAVEAKYEPTPLLGVVARPPTRDLSTPAHVSRLLEPLKKHLLVADAVYIRDSFYYCFDSLAESQGPTGLTGLDHHLVEDSIRAIKDWLPILAELRPLIQTGALVFMPYYITPSFPYAGNSPKIKGYFKQLHMREGQGQYRTLSPKEQEASIHGFLSGKALAMPPKASTPVPWDQRAFDEDEVIGAWLNARIMHLDPVFPTKKISDWAARLYFDDGPDAADVTGDLISMAVLPFGKQRTIPIADLVSMRRDEAVFKEVGRIVADCKSFIEKEGLSVASPVAITAATKTYVNEQLDAYEGKSPILKVVKIADEKPIPGFVVSIAVGLALFHALPLVALIGGATLTPKAFKAIQKRTDPTKQAFARVQTLF